MTTTVIALGGNALLRPKQKGRYDEQVSTLRMVVKGIAKMAKKHALVLTHGNGPQVGRILLQQEKAKDLTPPMPLYVCVAQSQAQIGLIIQEALGKQLRKQGIGKPVVTFITRVLVDKKDKAFRNPTKPIGPFYTEKEYNTLRHKWRMVKDRGGYRRVVPSPDPVEIVEAKAITRLAKEFIIVACGGGGIPVVRKGNGWQGVDAVIDKDLAAEKLAEVIGADLLIILTDVENVSLNYGKPEQKPIQKMTVKQAKHYMKQGYFPAGTMGPKILAGIRFLEKGGEKVIITSFDMLEKALKEKAGTLIVK
jgi:carbamate kinase